MQVSVIVPVQDGAEHLQRAVESALAQPETAEVLLIVDGTSPASLAVCQHLVARHDRVRLCRQPNGAVANCAASRNLGVQESRYDLLAFLNPDSRYLAGRFGTPRTVFEASPDVDGVFEQVVASDGAALQQPIPPGGEALAHLDVRPRDLLAALAIGYGGGFHFDGLTVRRRVFAHAGFFDEDLAPADEAVFRIKLAAICKLVPGNILASVARVSAQWREVGDDQPPTLGERFSRARAIQRALRRWSRELLNGQRATLVQLFGARCLAETLAAATPARPIWLSKLLKRAYLTLYALGHPRLLASTAFWRIILSFASPLAILRFRLPKVLWQRWLAFQAMPRERLVMFHAGRSGSTVVGDLLNQHPSIGWYAEVIPRFRANLRGPGARALLAGDPSRLLLDDLSGADRPVYGCEVKLAHIGSLGLTLPDFVAILDRLGFRHCILLERKNVLRIVASNLVAQEQVRFTHPAHTPPRLTRITIDPDCVPMDGTEKPLLAFMRDYQQDLRTLRQLLAGWNVLELTYENDVLPDPTIAYRRVCAQLGLQPLPVNIHLGRSNPFSLREIVDNYDQIEQLLRGTEFAWMLED